MAVLNEKNIKYDIEYIDLSNKPDWFLEISPTGKVPIVQTPAGDVLFESAIINEYLDEVHEPKLMPESPLEKAQDRMWSDFVSGLYGDAFRLNMAKDEEAAMTAIENLKTRFAQLEKEIVGPLFRGENFTLIDATAAPVFSRIAFCQRMKPSIDVYSGLPKVTAWRDALLARPSVVNSKLPNLYDFFVERVKQNDGWLGVV